MMISDWLTLVPTCDAYAYNAALICEDCADKTIEKLDDERAENTGDSNDFPQGPVENNESDSPGHCDNNEHCTNAVKIPGGKKIGCPLTTILTSDGVEYTRNKIAEHILFGTPHQKCIGRLWLYLYSSQLGNFPLIQLHNQPIEVAAPLKKALSILSKTATIEPKVFSDLEYVYGTAVPARHYNAVGLWRLSISDTGKLGDLKTALLPASELQESSVVDILTAAISEEAWD
jgi:hypothetical protein